MGYNVKVSLPNRPQGDPVEVPFVGVVQNGNTVKAALTAEAVEALGGCFGVTVTPEASGGLVKGGEEE